MKNKNLLILAIVAFSLAGVAYFCSLLNKPQSSSVQGREIVPLFNVADIASIEIGGEKPLMLSAGDNGWKVDSLFGYPADITKIRENVLKLRGLKAGQAARGVKTENPIEVSLSGKEGEELARVTLGAVYMRSAKGRNAMFGPSSFPAGRYVLMGDETVLVQDPLEAFDGDPLKWIDTRISDVPEEKVVKVVYSSPAETFSFVRKDGQWNMDGLRKNEELDSSKLYSVSSVLSYLNLSEVADPSKEKTYGFEKGSLYGAVLENGIMYRAQLGNEKGDGRYMRLSSSFTPKGTNTLENAMLEKSVKEFNAKVGNWIYVIPSYSASAMMKKRSDFIKQKEDAPKGK